MARVNITIADDVLDLARAAGLNVSRLAAAAVTEELDRLSKIAALDAYLSALDTELGPVPQAELEAAATWLDRLTSHPTGTRAAGARQTRSA